MLELKTMDLVSSLFSSYFLLFSIERVQDKENKV